MSFVTTVGTTVSAFSSVLVLVLMSRLLLYGPATPFAVEPVFDSRVVDDTNTKLRAIQKLPGWRGPETIVFDAKHQPYGLQSDGRIAMLRGGKVQTHATVGGRPLGGAFDQAGGLWVADAVGGLLRVPKDPAAANYQAEVVANRAGDRGVRYANDVAIGPVSGRLYWTDSSDLGPARSEIDPETWDTFEASISDALRGSATGRLLRTDPARGTTEVLAEGIWFANGVTVPRNESFVLVCETYASRILRFWLHGDRKGSLEVFATGFPGYCDGIALSVDDASLYVAIPSLASPLAPLLALMPPSLSVALRNVLLALPLWIRRAIIKPVPYGCVLRVGSTGQVEEAWNDPGGLVAGMVTGVTPHPDGTSLYLGSLRNDFIGVLALDGG